MGERRRCGGCSRARPQHGGRGYAGGRFGVGPDAAAPCGPDRHAAVARGRRTVAAPTAGPARRTPHRARPAADRSRLRPRPDPAGRDRPWAKRAGRSPFWPSSAAASCHAPFTWWPVADARSSTAHSQLAAAHAAPGKRQPPGCAAAGAVSRRRPPRPNSGGSSIRRWVASPRQALLEGPQQVRHQLLLARQHPLEFEQLHRPGADRRSGRAVRHPPRTSSRLPWVTISVTSSPARFRSTLPTQLLPALRRGRSRRP